jgi:AAA+ superfamily predicted ATPase
MMVADARPKLLGAEPAYLRRIRLRAQRRTRWLRHLWSQSDTEPTQGMAISHEEMDRIVAGRHEPRQAEDSFYTVDPAARAIHPDIVAADAAFAEDPVWEGLRRHFSLSSPEADLLGLAVALEADPPLGRAYAYLHDDASLAYPTPWLAASLFQWPPGVTIEPDCPLVHWRMAQPREGVAHRWSAMTPWAADPGIVSWLVIGRMVDTALDDMAWPYPVGLLAHTTCLYPEQLEAMKSFVDAMWHAGHAPTTRGAPPMPIEIEIIGPDGSGKRTLAAQLCGELQADMLVADAGILLGGDVSRRTAVDHAIRVVRAAALTHAIPYWHNADRVDPHIWTQIQGHSNLAIFGASLPSSHPRHGGVLRKQVHIARLPRSQRLALWNQITHLAPPLPVREWALTPAELTAAARFAPMGEAAVVEACREALHREPGELFTPLVCPYTWDDIVLAEDVRRHLAELEEQARRRSVVYEDWGFERLVPLGRGVTALFAGPSGTGKTMAAQVLARALDVELYRVDLAGVVNKYIGETEKRLKQVFDACERSNVLLFFDEADALFGQRTQVKDAHDRFANIEIDYLLQRMEQFDGIAILATNRKSDLDSAFMRRIRFIVDFPPPGPDERLTLWHLAFAAHTPRSAALLDQIDWQFLASKLNLTGAQIKAVALGAAFLAHTAGTRITMRHILHAAQRESSKTGMVLRDVHWEG